MESEVVFLGSASTGMGSLNTEIAPSMFFSSDVSLLNISFSMNASSVVCTEWARFPLLISSSTSGCPLDRA